MATSDPRIRYVYFVSQAVTIRDTIAPSLGSAVMTTAERISTLEHLVDLNARCLQLRRDQGEDVTDGAILGFQLLRTEPASKQQEATDGD